MFEGSRARRAVRNLLWNTCLAQRFETVRPERRPALRGVINPRALNLGLNPKRTSRKLRDGEMERTRRRLGDGSLARARASSREIAVDAVVPSTNAANGGAGGVDARVRAHGAGAEAADVARAGREGRDGGHVDRGVRRSGVDRASECAQNLRDTAGGRPPRLSGWRPFLNRVVDIPRHHSHAPRRCP